MTPVTAVIAGPGAVAYRVPVIVTAGNRSVVAVLEDGKVKVLVLVPAHELERIAPVAPRGTTLESVTPIVCDTAEELREVLGSLELASGSAQPI